MTKSVKTRALGATGLVAAAVLVHLLAILWTLDAPERLSRVHEVMAWVGHVLGIAGTLGALLAFSRTDYLSRVWAFTATGALLLTVGTAARSLWQALMPGVSFIDSQLVPYRAAIIVGANVALVVGMALMAWTFRRSGLRPAGAWQTRLLQGVCVSVALWLLLPTLGTYVRNLDGNRVQACIALVYLVSALGDLAVLVLLVPILRVALMLRGGRLAWVWWAMTLSGLAWLAHDAAEPLAQLLPGNSERNLELLQVLRTAGLTLMGLAGHMQRVVVTSEVTRAPAPALQTV